jgi:hypothetical protein
MLVISRALRQDSVTIFNAIAQEDNKGFEWQRTVIEGVRVEKGRGMLLREKGIESSEKALLIIELRDYKATDKRKYANAKEWEKYGEEEKKRRWTINSARDFFILGVVSDRETVVMVGVDREEQSSKQSSEEQSSDFVSGVVCLGKEGLMNKYEVFSITDLSEEKGSGSEVIMLRVAAK